MAVGLRPSAEGELFNGAIMRTRDELRRELSAPVSQRRIDLSLVDGIQLLAFEGIHAVSGHQTQN